MGRRIHKGRYLKQLGSALEVRGGDDRGLHMRDFTRLEEVVSGPGQCAANARNRCNDGGARPQVHVAPQKLQSTSKGVSSHSRAVWGFSEEGKGRLWAA